MKNLKRMTVKYRRKRNGLTNYKKRLALLKSGQTRFVIRKSLNNMTVQIVQYDPDGDKVLYTASSQQLKKFGWKGHTGNLPSAYLTGYLAGVNAKKVGISKAVIDIGLQRSTKGSRLYATVKGAITAGLVINVDEKILPTKETIQGKYIKADTSVDDVQKAIGAKNA